MKLSRNTCQHVNVRTLAFWRPLIQDQCNTLKSKVIYVSDVNLWERTLPMDTFLILLRNVGCWLFLHNMTIKMITTTNMVLCCQNIDKLNKISFHNYALVIKENFYALSFNWSTSRLNYLRRHLLNTFIGSLVQYT